jgi:hypothetical protein
VQVTVSCQVGRREGQVSDETIGTGRTGNRPKAGTQSFDPNGQKQTLSELDQCR